MGRFHFDLSNGTDVEPDPDGVEFADLETAYLDAFRAATEIWAEMLARQEDPRELTFIIYDEAGRLLLTLPFSEILDATKRTRPKAPNPGTHNVQCELERTRRLKGELAGQIVNAQRSIEALRALLHRGQDQ